MNKLNKKLIIINLIIIYLFVNRFFIIKNYLAFSEGITASFSILLLVLSVLFFGYSKTPINDIGRKFLKLIGIALGLYFVGIYGAGLFIGFLANAYSLNPLAIIDNTFNIVFFMLSIEMFRYVFINAKEGYGVKGYIYIITFLITLLEANLYMGEYAFSTLSSSFKFITIIFIPILVKNIMCSYLSCHSGWKVPVIYRLIMDLYVFIAPLQPDLNDYFMSITSIMLPYIILIYAVRIVECNNRITNVNVGEKVEKTILKLSDIPFILFLVAFGCIVFGIGPLKLIGIETGSMQPVIKIGDAVLINKNCDREKLEEGDIIAYRSNDNLIIVHRIYKINKDGTFITKGDFNNSADALYVSKNQVQGKVLFKVPFIAYPTIYFKK